MQTQTRVGSIVGIRKVFENFAADLSMLVRVTRTMDLQWAQNMAHDVMQMAIADCLSSVHVQLFNSYGMLERAHKYAVRKGGDLSEDRPGGNYWPEVPGGRLVVLVYYSDRQEAEKLEQSGLLRLSWTPSGYSTNYSNLGMRTESTSREYSSHNYGLSRTSYSA